MIYIVAVIAVFAVIWFVAGCTAFRMGFSRKPVRIAFLDKKAPGSSQWEEWRESINTEIEKIKKMHTEEWEITSFDGLKLRGSFIPHHDPKRTILCIHGYRSSGFFDFSMAVEYFLKNNCNLLIIDQRAHGRSEGNTITFGVNERYDVRDWAWYLAGRTENKLPIYFDGVSMGCATALMASSLELPTAVKGIIADCGYTSCHDIMKKVISEDYKIPLWLVFPVMNMIFRFVTGHFMNEIDTRRELANNTLAVLFAHGESDDFVPHEMTLENHKACTSQKYLHIAQGAQHGMSFIVCPEEYKTYLMQMFEYCEK